MVKYHPIFGVIVSFTKDNTVGFQTRFGDRWEAFDVALKLDLEPYVSGQHTSAMVSIIYMVERPPVLGPRTG